MLALLLACAISQTQSPTTAPARAAAADYLSLWKGSERRALGMAPEHATAFRASEHKRLVRLMGQRYGVTEAELRRAVRLAQSPPPKRATPPPATPDPTSERIAAAKPGAVGRLERGSFVAPSALVMMDVSVSGAAGDKEGIRKTVLEKKGIFLGEATGVRVLEVFDYQSIGKGIHVRVRFTDGPAKDEAAYCFPWDIDFRSPPPERPAPGASR